MRRMCKDMRKIILYIAMSLDGYIADKNGGVDWLSGQGAEGAEELTSYVITHRNERSTDNIKFVGEAPCELTARLKEMPGKDIWICGGSNIIQPLIRENLIDEYRVSVIPTILGDGILLFGKRETELQLQLKETKMYNGITEIVYTRR